MATHSYVVRVERPHPKHFAPERPITDLVRNQILHLSLAERHLPKRDQSGIDIYSIQTEGEASEYISHVTAKLHPQGAPKVKAPRQRKTKSKKGKPTKRGKRKRS